MTSCEVMRRSALGREREEERSKTEDIIMRHARTAIWEMNSSESSRKRKKRKREIKTEEGKRAEKEEKRRKTEDSRETPCDRKQIRLDGAKS